MLADVHSSMRVQQAHAHRVRPARLVDELHGHAYYYGRASLTMETVRPEVVARQGGRLSHGYHTSSDVERYMSVCLCRKISSWSSLRGIITNLGVQRRLQPRQDSRLFSERRQIDIVLSCLDH